MKKKRLLFLTASFKKGGAERVMIYLMKYFDTLHDFEVHFILMEDENEYTLPNMIKPIILSTNKKTGIEKFIEIPYKSWRLKKYVQENNIDIVMSFVYRPNYINIVSKLFGSKHKTIINVRSTTSRYKNEGLLGKVNLFLIKRLFNKADLIISNSTGVDNDLKSLMNISVNTKIIHNPVDTEFINNRKNICEDIDFKFNRNIKYIISVGRLIPLKRNYDLILAFYELQKYDDTLELIFVGDGILKNNLIAKCKSLNIKEKVNFLGNVKNPFYYLNKSNLFVLNSQTEGFPNVLVEAMACGLPVISSDCKSGPREILKDEKYGLLYDVGNIEQLIEKIKKYLYSNINMEEISKMNLNRIKEFQIDKIMNEFKEALNEK